MKRLFAILLIFLLPPLLISCSDGGTSSSTSQSSRSESAKKAASEVRSLAASERTQSSGSMAKKATAAMTVIKPNGGEKWQAGKRYLIKWEKGTLGDDVLIYLYRWVGNKLKEIRQIADAPNTGKYYWTIPSAETAGTNYDIFVQSWVPPYDGDFSDSEFTITKGPAASGEKLKITYPNGKEVMFKGLKRTIQWNKGNGGSKVKIELLKSKKLYKTIKKSTKNDGSHKWKVPSSVKDGSKYTIKITSISKKTVSDSSDKYFTVD